MLNLARISTWNTLVHHSARRFASNAANAPLPEKVLIANRGEIACRVIRTARTLGVRTVAIYSEEDKNALHAEMADEAICIGGRSPSESYLIGDKVLWAAKKSGSKAIHPGYGFLSENAEFADAVENSGLIFVGPPASAIRAMGSKSASKILMQQARVPVVPGYHGDNQDPEFLLEQAKKIGFPLIIKPIMGGGGKGMKIVYKEQDFIPALQSAQREAASSFGNSVCLIERYITRPRHVEMQVFADKHGNAVHLFERDCSVQRRHQKIIEEAPGPGLTEDVRRSMGEKAVAAAKAVNYVGAGTVEFIFDRDTDSFYFMEMNTRLQVEHPVTEMITGVDLVKWQLEVAAGRPLPVTQESIHRKGHAFEARVYAEDPYSEFLPQAGRVIHVSHGNSGARIDSGVRDGDLVGVFYDPMLAKVIVHGPDRNSALAKLRTALLNYKICGMKTNIPFLHALASHPAFIDADLDTRFIERHHDTLLTPPAPPKSQHWALAAIASVLARAPQGNDAWDVTLGLRLNAPRLHQVNVKGEDAEAPLMAVDFAAQGVYEVQVGSERVCVSDVKVDANGLLKTATIDGERFNLTTVTFQDRIYVLGADWKVGLIRDDVASFTTDDGSGKASSGNLRAPLTGKVVKILANSGAQVTKGEPVIVIEAMKMEHTIVAPVNGTVEKVHFKAGDFVDADKIVVSITPAESS